MAQRNLRGAVAAVGRQPDRAAELGVQQSEVDRWRSAADGMAVPYDERLGVHPQAERFTDHVRWDFENTPPENYPLMLHYPYGELYRKQVIKQADLVMALLRRGDAFTPEEKARDFAYYEELTVRDSSLSSCIQAAVAAEVGQLDLAYDYLGEAALMDLADLEHNTRDGVHVASLAGAWIALVVGFGGMRESEGHLRFSPRLPRALTRLCFRVMWRGQTLRVDISRDTVQYQAMSGPEVEVVHFGQPLRVGSDAPVERPIPPVQAGPRPGQPKGREPARREPRT
jgi:alpha,alpha-trehalose phosphorylase